MGDKMSRRDFLKMMGIGAVGAGALYLGIDLLSPPKTRKCDDHYDVVSVHGAWLGEGEPSVHYRSRAETGVGVWNTDTNSKLAILGSNQKVAEFYRKTYKIPENSLVSLGGRNSIEEVVELKDYIDSKGMKNVACTSSYWHIDIGLPAVGGRLKMLYGRLMPEPYCVDFYGAPDPRPRAQIDADIRREYLANVYDLGRSRIYRDTGVMLPG